MPTEEHARDIHPSLCQADGLLDKDIVTRRQAAVVALQVELRVQQGCNANSDTMVIQCNNNPSRGCNVNSKKNMGIVPCICVSSCYVVFPRVRFMTAKEKARLQGWSDDDLEKCPAFRLALALQPRSKPFP